MQRVLCGVFGTGMRRRESRSSSRIFACGRSGGAGRTSCGDGSLSFILLLSGIAGMTTESGESFFGLSSDRCCSRRVPVLSGDERKMPVKTVCVSARRSSGEEREQGRKQGRSGLFFRPGTRTSCHRKKRVFPPDMSRTKRFGPGRHVLHPMSSIRSAGPGTAAS